MKTIDEVASMKDHVGSISCFFYAIYWLHFFVWSSLLGERTPNEKEVAVLRCQTPLTASQIETRGNLNTTPIIFIFRMMANFSRKNSQLISRRKINFL